ncbi:hypothetical protein HWV62_37193 [Athelia sp. TMB]|nr:hypothetical protein HWV62_37193 [Athelia sp. TMB]
MDISNADITLGPAILGVVIGLSLYGTVLGQLYYHMRSSGRNRPRVFRHTGICDVFDVDLQGPDNIS